MHTPELAKRTERAMELFEAEQLLAGRERWYDARACRAKRWMQVLGLLIVVAGAGTTAVQVWVPETPGVPLHWTTAVTALLGMVVVVSKGVERIWDFDGAWRTYRLASESMTHERRSYLTGTGAYAGLDDEQAYRVFVERLESVIADEQSAYWRSRDGETAEADKG